MTCDCSRVKTTCSGNIPSVSTELTWHDRFGGWKARWDIGRMNYMVLPGLYAVGSPNTESVVLVTANYKLTFDVFRRELDGLDAWILVLDTKGINVWCAAGKGTFGTDELVQRIEQTGLAERVNHRRVIVPQLGGPGVAAHEVRKRTGFSVIYGPVRARDIKAFIDAGMKATEEMRRVRFNFYDRLVVAPVEFVISRNYLLGGIAVVLLVCLFKGLTFSPEALWSDGIRSGLILLAAYLAGTVLGPLLLPWLPGRSFSLKGAVLGMAVGAVVWLTGLSGTAAQGAAWMFMATGIASFLLMNFTGASTYTSLSGVKKEMRIAVPMQIATMVMGVGLWVVTILRS